MYAQCVNSIYTVHNKKYCLPKSTNAGKKKKKKVENVNWKMRTRRRRAQTHTLSLKHNGISETFIFKEQLFFSS